MFSITLGVISTWHADMSMMIWGQTLIMSADDLGKNKQTAVSSYDERKNLNRASSKAELECRGQYLAGLAPGWIDGRCKILLVGAGGGPRGLASSSQRCCSGTKLKALVLDPEHGTTPTLSP